MTYDSKAAADQLGIEPRVLRQFLRATPEWNNVGSGGRYSFTEANIATLTRQVPKWLESRAAIKKPKKRTRNAAIAQVAQELTHPAMVDVIDKVMTSEDEDGDIAYFGPPIPPRLTGAARDEANARVERLMAQLRARNLTLAQNT